MTLTHYSVLNQIFYPYKKFDDPTHIQTIEKWMFLQLSDNFQSNTKSIPESSMQNVVQILEPEISENPHILIKKEKSLFFSKKQDGLFWCAYAVFHGESAYWVIGNKYKNSEISEKQKIIDSIRSTGYIRVCSSNAQAYTKISNVKMQEIMSELMLDKKTSWNTFMAICAFYKFRAIVIRGKTYMDFAPYIDVSMGTYIFYKNEDGHFSVDTNAITDEKMNEIIESHIKIDCDDLKPLKAASYYKMEDLNRMARILGIGFGDTKIKKAELYDKIMEKVG